MAVSFLYKKLSKGQKRQIVALEIDFTILYMYKMKFLS